MDFMKMIKKMESYLDKYIQRSRKMTTQNRKLKTLNILLDKRTFSVYIQKSYMET